MVKNRSNETNLKQEKAEESCSTHVFTKRKSTMVSYQNHRADLVEAGRVELPSENLSTRPSTSVAVVFKFPFRGSQRQDPRSGSFINPARRKA